MKKMRRLFATLLVIAICMSVFVLPGYAITIYGDKGRYETYWDSKLCKNVTRRVVCAYVADDQWDDMGWNYKDGKATGNKSTYNYLGAYPRRAGVILVTSSASSGGVVGHAAIVYDSTHIIESVAKGVVIADNDWNTEPHSKGAPAGSKEVVAVTVKVTSKEEDADVAEWCKKQVGKSYNLNYLYMSTRNSFYCSHLVWAGFKDKTGIDLNTSDYTNKMIGPYELIPEDRLPDGRAWKTEMIYAQNWWGK